MSRAGSILFAPLKIGRMTIKNRFMRSATEEVLGLANGLPSKDLFDLLEAFAQGEVGLIVPGAMAVTDKSVMVPRQPGLYSKQQAEAWKPGIDRIHKYGAKLMFQLCHAGPGANNVASLGNAPLVPSALSPVQNEMSTADIERAIQQFIDAAKNAKIAGADAVQLHCAHGYLLSAFLSPYFNRRNDKWGGSAENRQRIVVEIASAIRKDLPGLPITMKMNSDDFKPNGVNVDLAAETVRNLHQKGLIDLFEISGGSGSPQFTSPSILNKEAVTRHMPGKEGNLALAKAIAGCEGVEFKEGFYLENTEKIRKTVPKALLAAVGTLREFDMMEDVVKNGIADIVSLSRPLIRDPSLVKKFLNGETDHSTCISCSACKFCLPKKVYCHVKNE